MMNHKMKLTLIACLVFQMNAAMAGTTIVNKIKGIGPDAHRADPWLCVNGEKVKPGDSIDLAKFKKNPSQGYVGGALRFGGCDEKDSYLGWVSFDVNDNVKISGYAPFKDAHITYKNGEVDASGNLTGEIRLTPIDVNANLMNGKAPASNADWQFVGANLSGLEFGKVISPSSTPNLSGEKTENSDLKDTQAFLSAGMNTFRIPLSWSYLQMDGAGKGEINQEYFNSYVKPLLITLTKAKVMTIVDLHAYMRYSTYGEEYSGCFDGAKNCPDGKLVLDEKIYQDIWSKIYKAIRDTKEIDMHYIAFDLMNEPVNVPNELVFTIQATLIKTLRSLGFDNYILVEGNAWSGLHSWTTYKWKGSDGKDISNASLFTRKNFADHGITDLSKILINVHQYLDKDYSGTQDDCLTNLKTTDKDSPQYGGFNLQAFVDYLHVDQDGNPNNLKAIVTEFGITRQKNCLIAMDEFMKYLKDNAARDKEYGFVGWTVWSTGHDWHDYKLRVTPTDEKMGVLKTYLQPISN